MKLNYLKTLFASLVLVLFVYVSIHSLLPSKISKIDAPETSFSTERALAYLEKISEKPHYIGSDAHDEVREYLITQLELLGLETHVQEGFALNEKWNVLAKPKNILARIKGNSNGKALMLLAHYDSAPHSFSYGASDAGSGVVAILEGVRAFLASGNIPENDIIILFSDAEEIGLLGAKLFVSEHPWVNDVGLVVNFEARGSGGPSSMIIETNGGNHALVKEFVKSKPSHPFASSLFYSVYKMLPNDTDSTVFREDADIDSYFFAFIDDHFDYHTSNDTFENLDRNTLEHQGSYVMAVLKHFSVADMQNLKSTQDDVYFNFPFVKMIHYPFSWITPMLLIAWLLFLVVVFYGFIKGKMDPKIIVKGSLTFLKSLLVTGVLAFLCWKLVMFLYPDYKEILHGYTYNGAMYILTFVFFTLSWCFWFYRKYNHEFSLVNIYVFPIFIWLIINTIIAIKLKGAAFFIIPTYFAIVSLFLLLQQSRKRVTLYLILSIPAVMIFAPLIQFFPIGLGLKMLFVSALFTTLTFGLLLPVLGAFKSKKFQAFKFLILGFVFLGIAHFTSSFTDERQKPNSLVYFYDADVSKAYWATFDYRLDSFTQGYIDKTKEKDTTLNHVAGSKYGSRFTYTTEAPLKEIALPKIVLHQDTLIGNYREIALTIFPQRKINRMVLYADTTSVFTDFEANGKIWKKDEKTGNAIENRSATNLMSYYVSNGDSLALKYRVLKDTDATITLQEISFDLIDNELFSIPKRPTNQMPKPFITTDAVIVQHQLNPKNLKKEEPLTGEIF